MRLISASKRSIPSCGKLENEYLGIGVSDSPEILRDVRPHYGLLVNRLKFIGNEVAWELFRGHWVEHFILWGAQCRFDYEAPISKTVSLAL